MFRKVKTIIDSNPQIPGRSWVESLAVGNAEENEDMKKINYYSFSWNFANAWMFPFTDPANFGDVTLLFF